VGALPTENMVPGPYIAGETLWRGHRIV